MSIILHIAIASISPQFLDAWMLKIGISRKLLQPLKKPTAQEKFLQKPLMYKDIFIMRTIRQIKFVMTEKYTTKTITIRIIK